MKETLAHFILNNKDRVVPVATGGYNQLKGLSFIVSVLSQEDGPLFTYNEPLLSKSCELCNWGDNCCADWTRDGSWVSCHKLVVHEVMETN
jgi:hypothetical protein